MCYEQSVIFFPCNSRIKISDATCIKKKLNTKIIKITILNKEKKITITINIVFTNIKHNFKQEINTSTVFNKQAEAGLVNVKNEKGKK